MLAFVVLLLVLVVIIYQDFKERLISFWTIPLLFFTGLFIAYNDPKWTLSFLLFNCGFVLVQLAGVTLYFSIKYRRFVNITTSYLGIGDVLFFFAISPLFSPVQFCCFFILALISSLIVVVVYQLVFKSLKTVPLAGLMSFFLIVIGLLLFYLDCSFYDDWLLLGVIF